MNSQIPIPLGPSAVGAAVPFNPRSSNPERRAPWFVDPVLPFVAIGLVLFSLVMLYSTTGVIAQEKFDDELFFLKRQSFAAVIGIAAMFICSRIPLQLLRKVSPFLIIPAVLLLVLTFIPGLGDSAGGAQRWVKLGPVRFQPGEFVKLCFVIFLAGFWARHEEKLSRFSYGIVRPVLLAGGLSAMLLLQPDFGSSSIIILVTLATALCAGAQLRWLFIGGSVVAAGMGLLVWMSPYRMARIMSFLDPFHDASGRGYQLIQSLIAVGSGKLTGLGLGASQQKLFYLPAAHTDFIFAVISEELGFIGAVSVLIAFLVVLWRGLRIANMVAEDTFQYTLAVGMILLVVLPALLNIGVVIGRLPTKGLVLPLVGYGGSSLITSLVALGILLAIGRSAYRR